MNSARGIIGRNGHRRVPLVHSLARFRLTVHRTCALRASLQAQTFPYAFRVNAEVCSFRPACCMQCTCKCRHVVRRTYEFVVSGFRFAKNVTLPWPDGDMMGANSVHGVRGMAARQVGSYKLRAGGENNATEIIGTPQALAALRLTVQTAIVEAEDPKPSTRRGRQARSTNWSRERFWRKYAEAARGLEPPIYRRIWPR